MIPTETDPGGNRTTGMGASADRHDALFRPTLELFVSRLSVTRRPEQWAWSRVPGQRRVSTVFRSSAPFLRLKLESHRQLSVSLYDTFDWHLLRAGAFLFGISSAPVDNEKPGDAGRLAVTGPALAFQLVARIPGSEPADLADDFRKERVVLYDDRATGVTVGRAWNRAILPVGTVIGDASRYRILNDDDKQIGWLCSFMPRTREPQMSAPGFTMPPHDLPFGHDTWARLIPLRGFDRHFRPVGMPGTPLTNDYFADAVAAAGGRRLWDYPIDPAGDLNDSMSVRAAVPRLVGRLVSVVRANEAFLTDPPDDEFLHDYRVALRRMQTLVRTLERCHLAQPFDLNSENLKQWMVATSTARDLDVFLSDLRNIRLTASASLQAALEPLEASVRTERTQAYRELQRVLAEPRRPWDSRRIDSADDRTSTDDGRFSLNDRISTVADYAIAREEKRFVRQLEAILDAMDGNTEPDEEALHQLRIRVKRYRYATDLFGSVSTHPGGDPKTLKRLQDRLGNHHDLVVRKHRLERYWQPGSRADRDGEVIPRASAAGMLYVMTDQHLQKQRDKVIKALRRYAGDFRKGRST